MASRQLCTLFFFFSVFLQSVQARRLSRTVVPDQSELQLERLKYAASEPEGRRYSSVRDRETDSVVCHSSQIYHFVQTLQALRLAPDPLGADQLIGWSLNFSTKR